MFEQKDFNTNVIRKRVDMFIRLYRMNDKRRIFNQCMLYAIEVKI